MIALDNFIILKECVYKNEKYSVRDNGAVLRYTPVGKRVRPTDNKWTFGKQNIKTGYLEIASVRIHRIVATAFLGEPPTKEYVVDHIDTNKLNNRPDNLRWVTRLENVLLNPITIKRIETTCGCSVEEFLADPSKFRDKFQDPNYSWMCAVSKEEAMISKRRLLEWAKSDKKPSGGSLGDWVYNKNNLAQPVLIANEFIESLTENALQENWKTPSEFPLCPVDLENNHISTYEANLRVGIVFSVNQYSSSIVENYAISTDKNTLWIMCKNSEEDAIKPFSLVEVTYKVNFFNHKSLGNFFERNGVEKQFVLLQGLEWNGGDSIDDYS